MLTRGINTSGYRFGKFAWIEYALIVLALAGSGFLFLSCAPRAPVDVSHVPSAVTAVATDGCYLYSGYTHCMHGMPFYDCVDTPGCTSPEVVAHAEGPEEDWHLFEWRVHGVSSNPSTRSIQYDNNHKYRISNAYFRKKREEAEKKNAEDE